MGFGSQADRGGTLLHRFEGVLHLVAPHQRALFTRSRRAHLVQSPLGTNRRIIRVVSTHAASITVPPYAESYARVSMHVLELRFLTRKSNDHLRNERPSKLPSRLQIWYLFLSPPPPVRTALPSPPRHGTDPLRLVRPLTEAETKVRSFIPSLSNHPNSLNSRSRRSSPSSPTTSDRTSSISSTPPTTYAPPTQSPSFPTNPP